MNFANNIAEQKEIRFAWVCRNIALNEIECVKLTDEQLLYGNRPSWVTSINCEIIAKIRPTGQKDKYENEIYEGDVLTYSYYKDYGQDGEYKDGGKVVVKWCDNIAAFSPLYGWSSYGEQLKNCEIIGNIYINPELLEER
jgi:uncharacterized phage protein (TIGR01671 family)